MTKGAPQTPAAFARDFLLGESLLFRRVIEDRRAVLRAGVGALAVERRWIVEVEEDVEQFAEREDFRIEGDLHDFGVSGGAAQTCW